MNHTGTTGNLSQSGARHESGCGPAASGALPSRKMSPACQPRRTPSGQLASPAPGWTTLTDSTCVLVEQVGDV